MRGVKGLQVGENAFVICAGSNQQNAYMRAFSLNGDDFVFGNTTFVTSTYSDSHLYGIEKIRENVFCTLTRKYDGVALRVHTINGTNITINSQVFEYGSGGYSVSSGGLVRLKENRIALCFSGGYIVARIIDFSPSEMSIVQEKNYFSNGTYRENLRIALDTEDSFLVLDNRNKKVYRLSMPTSGNNLTFSEIRSFSGDVAEFCALDYGMYAIFNNE